MHQMTYGKLILALNLLCLSGWFQQTLEASDAYVRTLRFVGLERTDEAWLRSYLGLENDLSMSEDDIPDLIATIQGTGLFHSISGQLVGSELIVALSEKWTFIPVLRQQRGGGAALNVLGAYEANLVGRLWTLGGELRQYDQLPLGGVLFTTYRSGPKGLRSSSIDAWRLIRQRPTIPSKGDRPPSLVLTQKQSIGTQQLWPAPIAHWQGGFQAEGRYSRIDSQTYRSLLTSLALVHDDLSTDVVEQLGQRWTINLGTAVTAHPYPFFLLEGFVYKQVFQDHVFAWHLKLHTQSLRRMDQSLYLGGLETVRGIPDGALRGYHALSQNLEWRTLGLTTKYLVLGAVAFADAGLTSTQTLADVSGYALSAGVGLRVVVPQVYRLRLRLDWAWPLWPHRGVGSLSAGLGELFQPHRPVAG